MESQLIIQLTANWENAAKVAAESREAYRVAHGKAQLASQQKTEATRKADADVATSDQRKKRDADEIEERKHYHLLIAERGSAGEPERGAA